MKESILEKYDLDKNSAIIEKFTKVLNCKNNRVDKYGI